MLIDTHAHLNFSAYKDDAEDVIKRTLASDTWVLNVGSQYETSKRAVYLAEKYEKGVYAVVGMHPIHVETGVLKVKMDAEEILSDREKEKEFDAAKYKQLAQSKKVVAIGEIGLDYYYRPKTKTRQEIFKEKQKEVFLKQLDLAQELELPVIFHCRMAHNDLIQILSYELKTINHKLEGVIHCFTGTIENAEKYIDMGFYIGLNGIIFKLNLDEVIKKAPLEKILVETDCPYLTPPQEGNKRNEPLFVKYVVQRIAEIKNLTYEKVAEITTQNAKTLFRI